MKDSVGHWIGRVAERHPERVILETATERFTATALQRRIAVASSCLRHRFAVEKGDRVVALAVNHVDFLALFFACARLGAIFLPLNWRLAPAEWRQQIIDSAPRIIFADPAFAALLAAAGVAAHDFAILRDGEGDAVADTDPEDIALMVYTSGTTGRPKGAMLSHRALDCVARNGVEGFAITSVDRVLSFLPMFHVGGLNIHTLPALRSGACVVLRERFDPADALQAIEGRRASLTLLVPAVMQAMIAHPRWSTTDLSSLRAVGAGSSVVPPNLIAAFHARDIPVMQVYGATETGPTATVLPRADAMRKAGSCGKPAAYAELDVFRDDATRAADDERGEICVRGDLLFSRYWRDEDATRAAFAPGGWYRTGDIGHRDAEGFFWVDDRKSDLIISGGENIYPAELEAVLLAHRDVAQCAVVAAPNERWGEVPVAFVVRRTGAEISCDSLLALFTDRLARFKHPREIRFVDALPMTALGKVERYRLRTMLNALASMCRT
jgi:fatty-acyl-CoA synthase